MNVDAKSSEDVDILLAKIFKVLYAAAQLCLPKKKYKSFLKPYWNDGDV